MQQTQNASCACRFKREYFMQMAVIKLFAFCYLLSINFKAISQDISSEIFPDGTPISVWFHDTTYINTEKIGKQYIITNYGAKNDSNILQTKILQKIIDKVYKKGGGVIHIPKGTFLTGALFFKPNTHLHLAKGAILKGSDKIENYPKLPSRMEGQNLDYFAALINAYGVNNFTISGEGTIDGNGLKFWEAFWQRRAENLACTNLEVSRPRLLFIRNCKNVQLQGIKLHNSGFWTCHLYKCDSVKILNLHIFSPFTPVKAPSTDAIDLDACTNVLIHGSYMSVNDDAIALKGGKGPWADKDTCNGANKNIIIQDCEFGFCHSALTLGSEAIHNRNIVMKNCYVNQAERLLWLKMRPDTPQKYEYVSLENIRGQACSLLYIKPWKQFFDLKGRKDMPLSSCEYINLKNIEFNCDVFFDVEISENFKLNFFNFQNLNITAKQSNFNKNLVNGFIIENVNFKITK